MARGVSRDHAAAVPGWLRCGKAAAWRATLVKPDDDVLAVASEGATAGFCWLSRVHAATGEIVFRVDATKACVSRQWAFRATA